MGWRRGSITLVLAGTLVACGPDVANGSGSQGASGDSGDTGASASETTAANEGPITSADDDTPTCVPGQSIACICVDGNMGAQVCARDGHSYEPCVCAGAETSSTSDAESSSSDGGSSSSGGPVECLSEDEPYLGTAMIDSVDDIAALAPYSVISGSLQIEGAAITSLAGLECLRRIGNQIYLADTTLLVDFTGLDNVEVVQGEIEIGWNSGLQSFVGLSSLTSANYMSIYDNDMLASFDGLESLTTIVQGFGANGNASLPNCVVMEFIAGLENPPAQVCFQDNLDDACMATCG